jgi:hypothetical protein
MHCELPSLAETAHQSWVREEEELLLMSMMMLWSPSMHVVLMFGNSLMTWKHGTFWKVREGSRRPVSNLSFFFRIRSPFGR